MSLSSRGVSERKFQGAHRSLDRREFVRGALVGAGTFAAGGALFSSWTRAAHAAPSNGNAPHVHSAMLRDASTMDVAQVQEAQQPAVTAGVVNMDGEFYKQVRRPAKPGAKPQMDAKQVDDLERRLACPCPCTLNVFTCRTTDFTCSNSPAVHADIQGLVAGGYSADEIMAAMIGTYGNNILMAPPKSGVNLVAWFGPFVAIAIGAVGVTALLRGWRRNAQAAAANASSSPQMHANDVGATNEEMARLRAALRDDDQR